LEINSGSIINQFIFFLYLIVYLVHLILGTIFILLESNGFKTITSAKATTKAISSTNSVDEDVAIANTGA
tara:strand:+ start:97 stop:306 length:210 start_codon:yes stop_codon:yes gene_type:complete